MVVSHNDSFTDRRRRLLVLMTSLTSPTTCSTQTSTFNRSRFLQVVLFDASLRRLSCVQNVLLSDIRATSRAIYNSRQAQGKAAGRADTDSDARVASTTTYHNLSFDHVGGRKIQKWSSQWDCPRTTPLT